MTTSLSKRSLAAWLLVCAVFASIAPALHAIDPTTQSAAIRLPTLSQLLPTDPQTPPFPAVVFESNRSGLYEIYAMNSDGRGLVRVTNGVADDAEGAGSPDWSPDGMNVTYSSRRSGEWDLFALQSGAEVNLTQSSGEDDKADWSPDGRRIVFNSIRNGLRWADIFVMDADGSRSLDLTDDGDDDREPVWSPNGEEIAFRSFRDGNYDLYALDIASRAPRRLTATDSPTWNASPAWSPDGHWIAFETNRDGNYEIYSVDNNGANPRNLTQNPADDKEPAWSPDGTQMIFTSNRDGNYELYRLSIASGAVTRLTYDCGRDHNADWRRGSEVEGEPVLTAVAYVTGDLNLRAGADASADTVGGAAVGDCLTVTGRSGDGQWLQVRASNGRAAWAARALLTLQGIFDALPVSS